MTNAEHIIAWAVNDRAFYDRLVNFEAKRTARTGMPSALLALTANNIASDAYKAGRAAHDMDVYSGADILDAAKLVLIWTVEG